MLPRPLLRLWPSAISKWKLKLLLSVNIPFCLLNASNHGCVSSISHVRLALQSILGWYYGLIRFILKGDSALNFSTSNLSHPTRGRALVSDDWEFPTLIFFLSDWRKWREMEVPGCLRPETSSCANYKRMLIRTFHRDLLNSTWKQTKQQLSSHSDIEMVSIKGVAMAITLITVCVLATHTSAGTAYSLLT